MSGTGGSAGAGGAGGMSGSGGSGGSGGTGGMSIDAAIDGAPDAPTCPASCDDNNPCTSDACDNSTGQCTHTPTSGTCDDGNACTMSDHCVNGACAGTVVNCDDGNPCTDDTCNSLTGCIHTNNTAACDDGDACTLNDTCANGACVGGPRRNCNDSNPCTADSCNPATGCVHTNDNTVCCANGMQCANGACGSIVCR